MKNILISFSGLNGCGKSTIVDLLEKHLITNGISVAKICLYHYDIPQSKILFRTAKYIRQMKLIECTPRQYDMLMASMGIVLAFENQAVSAMADTQVLLFDRYIETFLLEFNEYEPAKELLRTLPKCDVSFILDSDVATSLSRIKARGREMKSDIEDVLYKCKDYFDDVMKKDVNTFIVNSVRPVDEVFGDVAGYVDKFIDEFNNSLYAERL